MSDTTSIYALIDSRVERGRDGDWLWLAADNSSTAIRLDGLVSFSLIMDPARIEIVTRAERFQVSEARFGARDTPAGPAHRSGAARKAYDQLTAYTLRGEVTRP